MHTELFGILPLYSVNTKKIIIFLFIILETFSTRDLLILIIFQQNTLNFTLTFFLMFICVQPHFFFWFAFLASVSLVLLCTPPLFPLFFPKFSTPLPFPFPLPLSDLPPPLSHFLPSFSLCSSSCPASPFLSYSHPSIKALIS